MYYLIITVALGIAFAVFATQNTSTVTINLGNYVLANIAIYLIVLVSFFTGIFIAFVIYFIKNLSSSLTMGEKDEQIKKLKSELAQTTKEAHKLELENTKFKAESGEFDEDSI